MLSASIQLENDASVDVGVLGSTAPRVRRVPSVYRTNKFTNEVKEDKELPVKRCAVYYRLFYKEERSILLKGDQKKRAVSEDRGTNSLVLCCACSSTIFLVPVFFVQQHHFFGAV